jgi:hypothetical protein
MMGDRRLSLKTPPTSPRGAFASPISPTSPRPFPTFPLVPPAPVGTHPRHPTRQRPVPIEYPLPPATLDLAYSQDNGTAKKVLLELADGSSCTGFSFGAVKSVSGELVFQTGLISLELLFN